MSADASPTRSECVSGARHWWLALIFLLIPIVVAVVCLVRIPMPMTACESSEDGQFLLTGNHLSLEREGTDFRVLSFRSGETYHLRSATYATFTDRSLEWREKDSDRLYVKSLDLETFHETTYGTIDLKAYDLGGAPAIEPGIVAVISRKNELCAIDFRRGTVVSHPLPPLAATDTHFWLAWSVGPERVLLSEISNSASTGKDRNLLFAYSHGKLEQLAEWTANMIPREANGNLHSLTIDHQLEVRSLADGRLIDSHDLTAALNVTKPAGTWPRSVWISDIDSNRAAMRVRPSREVVYDMRHRDVVFRRSFASSRIHEILGDLILVVDDRAVDIWRISDQRRLKRIDFPQRVYDAYFIDDGQKMRVLLQDESVQVFDVASGRHLQTYRDRRWVRPTFTAMVIGAIAWAWLWVQISTRNGWHPLFDVMLIHGLVMAGLLSRLLLVGSLRDPFRQIYQFFEAIGQAWLLMLMLWFVFSPRRWSVKILAPLLAVAGAIGAALIVYSGERRAIWELLIGGGGIMVLLGILIALMRILGWRLIDPRQNAFTRKRDREIEATTYSHLVPSISETMSQDAAPFVQGQASQMQMARERFPLRDVFLMVAAVGAMFAVLRFVPASQLETHVAGMLALIVTTTTVMGIIAAWAALSTHRAWIRLAGLIVGIACAGSVHSLVFQVFRNLHAWKWHLTFAALLAVFGTGSLLIFRARGWRLSRKRLETI